MLMVERSL